MLHKFRIETLKSDMSDWNFELQPAVPWRQAQRMYTPARIRELKLHCAARDEEQTQRAARSLGHLSSLLLTKDTSE